MATDTESELSIEINGVTKANGLKDPRAGADGFQ